MTSLSLQMANTAKQKRERQALNGWTPTEKPLSAEESAAYQSHEEVIARNFKAFQQVGEALLDIRERRLYREEYSTFESYLSERWGMKHSQAYRLIDASKVMRDLSPIGDKGFLPANESQARELVSLPSALRPLALNIAYQAADGSPTAAHIRSAKHIVEIAVATGAIEDGEGNDIPLSTASMDHYTAAVTEDVYERKARQKAHIQAKSPAKIYSGVVTLNRTDQTTLILTECPALPNELGTRYRIVLYELG